MRYEIGEVVPVICFIYPSVNNFISFRAPYIWGDKEDPVINVKLLTVSEHHKVAWDQDPTEEKKHDGFLLKDENGIVFANQYPRASYGQISDRSDRLFDYFATDNITNEEIDALFDNYKNFPLDWEDITVYLDKFHEGINSNKNEKWLRYKLMKLIHEIDIKLDDLGFTYKFQDLSNRNYGIYHSVIIKK